ncbi:hypothetical protein RBSWK_02663 [Rhodopirellula baltica SWK14]|uniref:Uncharacterized protein n=1 Tax=Rhodopirellula baltica SWK14 TaxID=993516 RepID=L7CHB0_RHOBT|nr:hypothetical protein RBSWK_02663 [Rhodopirellula baltica SWK14]
MVSPAKSGDDSKQSIVDPRIQKESCPTRAGCDANWRQRDKDDSLIAPHNAASSFFGRSKGAAEKLSPEPTGVSTTNCPAKLKRAFQKPFLTLLETCKNG